MGRPKGFISENKGKICISIPGKTIYIKPEDLDIYLAQGWIKGNINDKQKSYHKKWYNNGSENILITLGQQIPDGFVPGMWQKRPGGFSAYNYRWYTNGKEQKRIKDGDPIPDGWYIGQADFHKQANRNGQLNKGNYHLLNKSYTDEYKELYQNIDKLKNFVTTHKDMTIDEMLARFNCSKGSLMSLLRNTDLLKEFSWYSGKYAGTSKPEKELVEYIKTIYSGQILENYRQLISPKEVDIYIPDKNLAIEYNGLYWHSTLASTDKNYHFNKSKLCEDKGIRLIHLYDWDLYDENKLKIEMMLKEALGVTNKIYARQCEIREITNKEAKILNEKVHLQGHRNAQITYGLFYNNELVQLMSFSKTRYNKNLKTGNSWEIIRGCPGSNTTVIGGVSKLFKHFIKQHNPDYIFSYCDYNKFNGISYEKLGMQFIGYTGPDKTWIVNGQPIKRNPKKYKQLKANSEAIVWGSGSKKYLWKKDQCND